ncbi:MAG TPA: hypothetical protein VM430_15930 [Microbacterium sp.]|nr:hypothetical protein [Microbacterium sp.]
MRAHADHDSRSSNLVAHPLGADTRILPNMTMGAIGDLDPVVRFAVVVSAVTWS